MVLKEDARLTVVMDCRGTSLVGFPLHMMKSCSVLVQENYPTRLAALFVINLPPVVHILAKAIMQVWFLACPTYCALYVLSTSFEIDQEVCASGCQFSSLCNLWALW